MFDRGAEIVTDFVIYLYIGILFTIDRPFYLHLYTTTVEKRVCVYCRVNRHYMHTIIIRKLTYLNECVHNMNINIAVRFDEHRVRLGKAQSTVSKKSKPHLQSPTEVLSCLVTS